MELKNITELNQYLLALQEMENALVVIAAKDTITPSEGKTNLDASAYVLLNRMGAKKLRTDNVAQQFWNGYLYVSCKGKPVYEALPEEKGACAWQGTVGALAMECKSAPLKDGNMASVMVNGAELAVNSRGLNFVVCNAGDGSLIDSACFDTWASGCGRVRQSIGEADDIEKHDVCVLGVWYGRNYGSLLNGYATYKLLNQLGQKVLMVKKPGVKNDGEVQSGLNAEFVEKYYKKEDIVSGARYKELNQYVGTFVAGSDQIWNWVVSFNGAMFLTFVDADKKKISFGTSFGHDRNFIPKERQAEIEKCLKGFDAISVREKWGEDFLNREFGVSGDMVVDPVFCIERKYYDEVAANSKRKLSKPYLLTYILDPTKEKVDLITYYCDKLGLQSVNIPDAANLSERAKNKEIFRPLIFDENVNAEDFLRLYEKADFVITDSFHGTAFAIIYRKKFISISNRKRGEKRFSDLLGLLELKDRYIEAAKLADFKKRDFTKDVDYSRAETILTAEVNRSREWLKDALISPHKTPKRNVYYDVSKDICTGCGACASICPVDAIEMKPNYDGFYNPVVDYDKCINCGKCSATCPALAAVGGVIPNENFRTPKCYEFITADEQLLWSSSSGGVFGELCRLAFVCGGVVYGAAWRDDFSVEHIRIESEAELPRLQKSKYLQSYTGTIFRRVKADLADGRLVLFSGTPCQVTGLKRYLGKKYDNLVLVDLLCGNAPSTAAFQKYLRDEYPEGVKKYEFRHKVQGWNADCVTVTVTVTDGTSYVTRGAAQDLYQRGYHSHLMCPVHCEHCHYQNAPRFGDLTIGDFWGISKHDSTVDPSKGISAVVINNAHGQALFDEIPAERCAVKKEVPVAWLGGNGFVNGNQNFIHPRRDAFYRALGQMGFLDAENTALKPAFARDVNDADSAVVHSRTTHFYFDETIWEEHFVQGRTVLSVKPGRAQVGKYATIMIGRSLHKGTEYRFKARVKFKSDSDVLNFHIKDSGTNAYQYFYSLKNDRKAAWQDVNVTLVPKSDIFDQFMFGASQLTGEGNYLAIDYMSITEVRVNSPG